MIMKWEKYFLNADLLHGPTCKIPLIYFHRAPNYLSATGKATSIRCEQKNTMSSRTHALIVLRQW